MKKPILMIVITLLAGLAFSTATLAGHGVDKAAGHHCKMHGGHHGGSWKDSLSKAQKDKLKQMKVDFLKVKFPLKAKMKTIKIELAVLATTDTPDQRAIDAKIGELLGLKKQLLKTKYAHKISVRKALNPEQRAGFDKYQLKKAKHKKCRKH